MGMFKFRNFTRPTGALGDGESHATNRFGSASLGELTKQLGSLEIGDP
jgi:hypothetical protein